MNRKNQDNKEVIEQAAEILRPKLEGGIPHMELVELAREFEVWPFEIVGALDAALIGEHFRPKAVAAQRAQAKAAQAAECRIVYGDAPVKRSSPAGLWGASLEEPVQMGESDPQPEPARVQLEPARVEPEAKPKTAAARPKTQTQTQTQAPAEAPQSEPKAGEWGSRLDFLATETADETSISLEQMQANGWPPSALKYPAFWGASNPPGRAARRMGWIPKFKDGFGVIFTRAHR